MILLVGVLVVSLPIAIALRTVLRLVRGLGRVDASLVGALVSRHPAIDLGRLADALTIDAPDSIAHRLVRAACGTEDDARPIARQLALAEAVAEVERDVVDDVRVPRVAASLATSGGLFAAALVMREGLGSGAHADDATAFFQRVIERGLILATLAVLGGLTCAVLHRAAQKLRRSRLDELDALALPLARLLAPKEPDR